MTLTQEQMDELDELAMSMPSWQKHLQEFREKHPEMSPQEVMKKAGFTYRMKKGKLVKQYLRKHLKKIMDEIDDL